MKHALLVLGALVMGLPGHSQVLRTYSGALTRNSPIITGDRLYRDGVIGACGPDKAYPGPVFNGANTRYGAHSFGNPGATPLCVTVSFTLACTDASGDQMFAAVYSGSFDPSNVETNYKTDFGLSPLVGSTRTMSFTLAPNEVVVLVANGLTSTSQCNAYSLTVDSPVALPVREARATATTPTTYPNPVLDVLHIKAEKAGRYSLLNATGAVVRRISGLEVSLADLPAGLYVLQDDATKATTRVVKL